MPGTLKEQILQQRKTLLLAGILLCEALLVFFHIAFTWPPPGTYASSTVRFFHLDREYNLPALFSAAQFLLLGGVLLSIRRFHIRQGTSKEKARLWLALALGAFFLAFDEALQIHETLGSLLGSAAETASAGSWLSAVLDFPGYYWALLYVPLALPAVAVTVVFLWNELGPQRWLPLVGTTVFLLGAVGLDFVEGGLGNSEHTPFPVHFLGRSLIFDAFLFEEFFEMFGLTIVLAGCLSLQVRLACSEEENRRV